MAALLSLSACDSEENDEETPDFYRIPVSVVTDMTGATTFLADNDAVLRPTNLSQMSGLKSLKRALISFSLTSGSLEVKSGGEYPIVLSTNSAHHAQIPTFDTWVDTSTEEYKTNGADSLAQHTTHINYYKQSGEPYVQNGYLNLMPTFDYSTTCPVYMGIYFDSENGVVAQKGEASATIDLYFDDGSDLALYSITTQVSIMMPDVLYDQMRAGGLADNDTLSIVFRSATQNGTETSTLKTTVGDLLLCN